MSRSSGTPLYCSPEVLKGEEYDESIDCYSFGMLLVEVAVDCSDIGGLSAFIESKWQQEKGRNTRIVRILRAMVEGDWHPFANRDGKFLDFAPISICTLAARCCSHDPALRPSFQDILDELSGPALDEVQGNPASVFFRGPPEQPTGNRAIPSTLHAAGDFRDGEFNDPSHEYRRSAHHLRVGSISRSADAQRLSAKSHRGSSSAVSTWNHSNSNDGAIELGIKVERHTDM